jgi:branched-chain amino acid transport system permease protein
VDFITFLQLVISGLAMGAIYALVALGFVLIYNAVGVVNFAQGEFIMIPAFFGITALVTWHLPVPIAYSLVLAAMAVFGLVFELVAYYPLRHRPFLPVVISTIGASILLKNLAQNIWGAIPLRFPGLFETGTINVGGLRIGLQHLLILGVTIILLILQYLLFEKTLLGKKMQATAQDKQTARLMGIPINKMIAFTFIYSALLGGVAALLVAPILNVTKDMGGPIALKAFSSSIIGGFGSIPGAILGGLFVGVIEAIAGKYYSAYTDGVAFFILIAVLLFRPQGIFGERIAEKVDRRPWVVIHNGA